MPRPSWHLTTRTWDARRGSRKAGRAEKLGPLGLNLDGCQHGCHPPGARKAFEGEGGGLDARRWWAHWLGIDGGKAARRNSMLASIGSPSGWFPPQLVPRHFPRFSLRVTPRARLRRPHLKEPSHWKAGRISGRISDRISERHFALQRCLKIANALQSRR